METELETNDRMHVMSAKSPDFLKAQLEVFMCASAIICRWRGKQLLTRF